MSATPSDAPLIWRMRHKIGRVWFALAIGMVALGALLTLYSISVADWGSMGAGLSLVIGGALLAVGFRRKGR